MNILKQKKTSNLWGYLMHIAGQLGYIITIVNLVLLIITTSTLLQSRGVMMPAWLLGLLITLVITVAGLIIFKLGLPSFFSAWNEQWYRHDNPLRKDIEEIKRELRNGHNAEHSKSKVTK